MPEQTYGHINSAFCDGMVTTVTAVHHFIWRHLYASKAAQTPASKLKVVTPDEESSMNTLWQEEEFEQICRRELLTEKVADIDTTIAVKKHKRKRYDFDKTMFYENRFWNRRPDGIVIKKSSNMMMMIAFITIKSSLVPLIEGLCAQIYFRFEISVVCSHLLLFFFVTEKKC